MKLGRTCFLFGVCGAFSTLSACTYGMVTDGTTGQAVQDGPRVSFLKWDTRVATNNEDPATFKATFTSAGATSVLAWPSSNGTLVGGYYLNPYAPLQPGDTTRTQVSSGWLRAEVLSTRVGYQALFYRNHEYAPCNAYTSSPYSGGPYPFSTAGGTVSGLCAEEDFPDLHGRARALARPARRPTDPP